MSLHSSSARVVAGILTVGQALLGVPVAAAEAQAVSAPSASAQPQAPVLPLRANRTPPTPRPPASSLTLPGEPTDAQLSSARIFAHPLVPIGRPTTREENAALAQAVLAYRDLHRSEQVAPLLRFLERYPQSAWRASLFENLGSIYLSSGYLSKALSAWDLAWVEAGAETQPKSRAVADAALGDWLELGARLGQVDAVNRRLNQIRDRRLSGAPARQRALAIETVRSLRRHPELAVTPGPAALARLWNRMPGHDRRNNPIAPLAGRSGRSTSGGSSLVALQQVAKRAGLAWRMARRTGSAPFPVPSIVHLRVNQFAAITTQSDGKYLLEAPAIGLSQWVTADTLNEETSGYVLAPAAASGADWATVPESEAVTVTGGYCLPGGADDNDPGVPPCGGGPGGGGPGGGGPPMGPPCRSAGMASYRLLPVGDLRLSDRPLTYRPAVGPAVDVVFTYNQRELRDISGSPFSNLGPQWTFEWVSYIEDDPNHAVDDPATVYLRAGGKEQHTGPTLGAYPIHWRSQALLARVSDDPVRYERRLPDGTVEVYAQSDGVIVRGRHVFLTEVTDPRGQTVHFTYDANVRLVANTDAVGLVTTMTYGLESDPWKITGVTDPFGRSTTLAYNPNGQLARITDAIGLTSSFVYGDDDFIVSLTTPYGTTRFTHEPNWIDALWDRYIEAADPVGGRERVEYNWSDSSLPAQAPAAEVPPGLADFNDNLDLYNSFYWDKRTLALGAPEVGTATITHLLLTGERDDFPSRATSVPSSVKRPLEHRVWYRYPGQASSYLSNEIGTSIQPSLTARTLDDGTSQLSQATYNDLGQVTSRTDPLGRQTTYTYATNGIDLLAVHQTSSGLNDLLASYADYTSLHQPQTMTDAAGQTTTYTYNAVGQPLTITNAKSETTTLTYDADQRLATVTQPLSGAVTTYAYDAYGRVHTVTDPDGYVITTEYDAFDRPTRVTYPDGTTDLTTYDRLDVATRTDRLGRTTRYFYDALERLVGTRDPAGRTVSQEWCVCGSLQKLTDANGHATSWERDAQGRVTREVRADGTTATSYTYETTTSRLKTVTDPKGQVTTYTYNLDDTVQQVAYTNAAIATPSVSYTYDANYARVVTMVDGTGTTTYGYHVPGELGAGQVATVDGPLTDDTITYTYDELGRLASRAINGVAASQTYDALGRTTAETNVLGTFTYGYDGVSNRLASVGYPNGQTSAYAYLDNAGDHRLQTIHHHYPDGSTLSKFDYTYDAAGNILTWRQQADTTAVLWTYGYDPADQLTAAVKAADSDGTVLQRFAYAYDPAGNRTSEQIDDVVTKTAYDSLNRLVSQDAGGPLVFKGQLDEPSAVTINGRPATVAADHTFQGTAAVAAGTTTVTIEAVDPSGNAATAVYEVDQAAAGRTFAYDANGNLTSDGARTFEWDARNQLVAVTVGTHRSEITYDGRQRRVRVVEKESGVTQSDTKLVWCREGICEERAADGTTVTRRAFTHGEQVVGVAHFFTGDHLGSVADVTDSTSALLARYAFDAWGRRTVTAGADIANFGYAGYRWQSDSNLSLTLYRAYDPSLGRWLSEDPLGVKAGTNLYAYVSNAPTVLADPLGLTPFSGYNYCGSGSNGGAPTNALDAACQQHDQCYVSVKSSGASGSIGGAMNGCTAGCDGQLCQAASQLVMRSTHDKIIQLLIIIWLCRPVNAPPVIVS